MKTPRRSQGPPVLPSAAFVGSFDLSRLRRPVSSLSSWLRTSRTSLSGNPASAGAEIPTIARLGTPATRPPRAGTVVVMIEIQELTKTYGSDTAVCELTFTVRPGVVTGFLGPNGA